jgi:DnaJ-class molecular chaperone
MRVSYMECPDCWGRGDELCPECHSPVGDCPHCEGQGEIEVEEDEDD